MRARAYLVLLATLVLWSGNWIVARAVRADVAPGVATVGRLLLALAVLAPLVRHTLPGKLRVLGSRDWRVLAALGFFGGGVHLAMQWLGLHYTTATSATLYLSTSPIFILLLAAPLLGESIRPRQWTGVATSLLGVIVIAARGNLEGLATLSINVGDLLALGSMAMWAAYTVFLRLRRDALNTLEFLTMVCAFGLVWTAPWLLWDAAHGMRLLLSTRGALAVAYSAIGSLLLAYAGWSYVVARLGAARAGVSMHLMPALGVLMAMLFLGELPSWFHFVGTALILSGVALSSTRPPPAAG
jgi:drug/metabolite transporter (DMT)-like permease